MRGTGVTGSRVQARLVLKENSTDSVPMMVQQELSLSSALFASLGQGEAWEETRGNETEATDGGHQRDQPAQGRGFRIPSVPVLALQFTCLVSSNKILKFSYLELNKLAGLAGF